jgi:hypothetical protein
LSERASGARLLASVLIAAAGAASVAGVATARADTAAPTGSAAQAQAQAPAVKALLDRWVAAQNNRDFAGYGKLYAPQFHGVRRSGRRTVMLDRKGWLVDRKRMFKKPMTVSIADVQIDGLAVKLKQTFAQGTYKDVGPKVLLLQPSGSELVIAREEMLASEKSVNPGPLSYVSVMRDSGDGETDYEYLTREMCDSPNSAAPGGDVVAHVRYSAVPPGAKLELKLDLCRIVPSKDEGEGSYNECSCDDDLASDGGSVTIAARGTATSHRFPVHLREMPCGVAVRARMLVGGNIAGEQWGSAFAGSCPE